MGGGWVGSYHAILAITKGPQPGHAWPILMDAKPASGYFLSAHPDLAYALDGCPIHTDDVGPIQGLPDEPGIYTVYVAADFIFNTDREFGEWEFRIGELYLSMPLDIPETPIPDPRPPVPTRPIGFTHEDLRELRGMLVSWDRVHGIMNPRDEPGHQRAALFLAIIDRLLPAECPLCQKVLVSGPEIQRGFHQECIDSLAFRVEDEMDKLHQEPQVQVIYVEGQETPLTIPFTLGDPLAFVPGESLTPLLEVVGASGWHPGMGPPSWVNATCSCGRWFSVMAERDKETGEPLNLGSCSKCGGPLVEFKEKGETDG